MIVFDFECSQNHIFEGWFESLESFEEQNAKGLLTCPHCNDSNIRRVISPVAVKKSKLKNKMSSEPIDYEKLAMEVAEYFYNNSEDVGTKFTSEALKMHYGVSEKRSIRGFATSEEEETLKEEWIELFKIPSFKKNYDEQN